MGFLDKLKSITTPKKGEDVPWRFSNKSDAESELGKWLLKAEDDDAEAMYKVGKMHLLDIWVGIYPKQAYEWLLKAAQHGHVESHYWLATMHEENLIFCSHDEGMFSPEKAFEWYKKGAIKGHTDSQVRLASRYERGKGTSKNLVQAYRWYAMSGNAEYSLSRLREKMTDEELKEARDLLTMCHISEDKT